MLAIPWISSAIFSNMACTFACTTHHVGLAVSSSFSSFACARSGYLLLACLSSTEVQQMLDELASDPDDKHVPASVRNAYKCDKQPTGRLRLVFTVL